MIALFFVTALSWAEIPARAMDEMNFARLLATRIAMHFAHGHSSDGPHILKVSQLAGRVLLGYDGHLLMIGKPRTTLARRLRGLTRHMASKPDFSIVVYPPNKGETLPEWIERAAQDWGQRHRSVIGRPAGVAAADLLLQNAFGDWSNVTSEDMKRLKRITYADIVFGEAGWLPANQDSRARRELAALGFGAKLSAEGRAQLNDFLSRPLCGGDL